MTWIVYGKDWTGEKQMCNTPESALANLGVRCVEVKTRKDCACFGRCGRRIRAGEMALKTSQRVDSRGGVVRHAYCSNCYEVV